MQRAEKRRPEPSVPQRASNQQRCLQHSRQTRMLPPLLLVRPVRGHAPEQPGASARSPSQAWHALRHCNAWEEPAPAAGQHRRRCSIRFPSQRLVVGDHRRRPCPRLPRPRPAARGARAVPALRRSAIPREQRALLLINIIRMARSSSSFSAAWTAAALLLLLALLATPAARAQAPAPASATDASDVDPAANYTCPVTIDLPETAIPPECSSKEPKDVCQACLTQVVEKGALRGGEGACDGGLGSSSIDQASACSARRLPAAAAALLAAGALLHCIRPRSPPDAPPVSPAQSRARSPRPSPAARSTRR